LEKTAAVELASLREREEALARERVDVEPVSGPSEIS
jgi:hypothetical protein